jgi:hypothetical protein
MRDINWSVDFRVYVDGYEVHFSDLTENEQNEILEDIRNDYYSGTFIGDETGDETGD